MLGRWVGSSNSSVALDCGGGEAEEGEGSKNVLSTGNGELPGAWNRLHDNVGLLDARGKQLGFCAGEEGLNYCCLLVSGGGGWIVGQLC
jgi:hypothetical protein